jgi:hypothetical protein
MLICHDFMNAKYKMPDSEIKNKINGQLINDRKLFF